MKKKLKKWEKAKKSLYLALVILLVFLLSFIIHALFEWIFINRALTNGDIIVGTYFLGVGWCALPVWTQYTFLLSGIIGGYFLGQFWWRVVYIEKRHWRFRKK